MAKSAASNSDSMTEFAPEMMENFSQIVSIQICHFNDSLTLIFRRHEL